MKGKCIIISAPSGAGKTTIVQRLLKMSFALEFSISATNREHRHYEVQGEDYYFMSTDEFRTKIELNEFAEWEEVYPDQFYGTLMTEINRIWDSGRHVIFDVDVVGGLNLKKTFGDQALSIFIMAPSIDDLEKRLQSRSSESQEKINLRISKASEEMEYANKFDRIIVNDELNQAVTDAEVLVRNFLNNRL